MDNENAQAIFYTVLWVLSIPVGLLLIAVIFRLLFVLNDLGDFISQLRYEVHPMLRDVRGLTHRAEGLTRRAETYMDTLEAGATKTGQFIGSQVGRVAKLSSGASAGLGIVGNLLVKTLFKK